MTPADTKVELRLTRRCCPLILFLARSPIYAHFTETLGGLSAIRAFGHVNLFARTNERLVDNNFASQFALKVSIYLFIYLSTVS